MFKRFILLSFIFSLLFITPTFAEIILKDEAGILTPEERQRLLNSYTTDELTFIYTIKANLSDDSPEPHNTMLQVAQGRPVVMFYVNMTTRYASIDDDNAYAWGHVYYDGVWDRVQPCLAAGNNYAACITFLDGVNYFESNKFNAELMDYIYVWLRYGILYIIALIASLLIICGKAVKLTKGLVLPEAKNFVDESKTEVELSDVVLINKTSYRTDTSHHSSGHHSGGSHGHGHSRGGHF